MPNPKDVSILLTNLVPSEKYYYSFKSVGSNWPVIITPISGVFTSPQSSGEITASAYFCVTKDGCNENNEGYLGCTEDFCTIGDDYFSNIVVNFNSAKDFSRIYQSHTLKLTAGYSLPRANIETVKNVLSKDEEAVLEVNFVNLTPQKTYQYSVSALSANWPFVVSSPTGFFHSGSGGSINSPVKMHLNAGFCDSTGVCYNGRYGVLNYTINDHPKLHWYNPQATIRLSYFDTEYPSIIHNSDIAKFYCSGCNAPTIRNVDIIVNTPTNCT